MAMTGGGRSGSSAGEPPPRLESWAELVAGKAIEEDGDELHLPVPFSNGRPRIHLGSGGTTEEINRTDGPISVVSLRWITDEASNVEYTFIMNGLKNLWHNVENPDSHFWEKGISCLCV